MPGGNSWTDILKCLCLFGYKPYGSTKIKTKSHRQADLDHSIPSSFCWFRAENSLEIRIYCCEDCPDVSEKVWGHSSDENFWHTWHSSVPLFSVSSVTRIYYLNFQNCSGALCILLKITISKTENCRNHRHQTSGNTI